MTLTVGDVDIALNGIVLISQALDYEGSTSVHDNMSTPTSPTCPPWLRWRSIMASAGHGRSAGPDFLAEARAFARDEYGPALMERRPAEHRRSATYIRDKLVYFTGLDPAIYRDVKPAHPDARASRKSCCAMKGVALGRLDGRYLGDEADDASPKARKTTWQAMRSARPIRP
jgi:hypothetical protein